MADDPSQIDKSEAEWILLMSANEDYVGLYEAIWEFNSRFPAASLGEKYDAADHALRSLHSKGLIEFHRMIFSDDYKNHNYEPLNPADLDDMFTNPVSWYPDSLLSG